MCPPSPPPDEGNDRNDAARPVEFDAPTDSDDAGDEPPAPDRASAREDDYTGRATPETTSESLRRTLDGLLPEASVESNWWYWIAAVPLYFLVILVGGAVATGLFVVAGLLDIAGFSGLASLTTLVLVGGVAGLFGLVGMVVAVVFPVATYVDARAVEAAESEWTPDPVLWGLLAVVAVLVTNFVASVPLALYYLYRRHEAVGTP